MKTLLKMLFVLILSVCTIEARTGSRGFSSSSRSFSSKSFGSSSRSYGSSSKSYGWGSSSSSKSSSSSAKYNGSGSSWFSKPGSASKQTSTRVGSKVEVSRYQNALKSGKAFTTREAAVADFKAKNANTFVNKFKAEPTTRPNYIPAKYRDGGKTYDVVYNKNTGGYGYWSGGGPNMGTWMMYDTLSDMTMMNSMMARQNYYVGKPVVSSVFSKISKVFCYIAIGGAVAFVATLVLIRIFK